MNDNNVHTTGDASEIDYQEIQNAVVNALNQHDNVNSSSDSEQSIDDFVSFASGTDASYMTVGVDVAPTTCAQQTTIYLVDIRNILFLLLCSYLVFNKR